MATPHSFVIDSQARLTGYRARLGFKMNRPPEEQLRGTITCEHRHSDRREAEACAQDFIRALLRKV